MPLHDKLRQVQSTLEAPKNRTNSFGKYNYRSCEDILEAVKHINYDPETGTLTRADRRKGGAGSVDAYGYLIIKIKGVQWKAHRLAWAKHYGVAPTFNIDHIDGDKQNNAISNLRDVPQEVNVHNTVRLPNQGTGFIGIYEDKTTKGLKARFTTRQGGKTFRFRDIQQAVAFRQREGLPV